LSIDRHSPLVSDQLVKLWRAPLWWGTHDLVGGTLLTSHHNVGRNKGKVRSCPQLLNSNIGSGAREQMRSLPRGNGNS
jgi:hypothetical protein